MAAPRKYPDELRERATRMAVEARRDPATRSGTFRRVGEQLGINPETLRTGSFNHRRLHGEIGMIPPVELEDIYQHHQTVPATADTALASL